MTGRRFRLPLLAVSLTLAFALATFLAPQSSANQQATRRVARLVPDQGTLLVSRIRRQRKETWHWQRLMGMPKTPASRSVEESRSLAYRRWVLGVWARRAARARSLALQPPHRQAFLCIHRYEASWTDPSPPYYGGLQMDLGFQRTYGWDLLRRKGTADHWTPLEQIWVAERAYRSGRGFYPWPNTARYCGLI